MHYSYFIAKRYLFSGKNRSNVINIISYIAALGVVIGAMALFVVLSGFSGLKEFSVKFTTYFDPDYKVFPIAGKTISITDEQRKKLDSVKGILNFSEVIEERVFLEFKDKQQTAYIKGVDTNYIHVIKTDSILVYGDWLTGNDYQVVAGNGISNALNMGVESTYTNLLSIYVPKSGKGIPNDPMKAFNKQTAVNIGLYSVNEEIDKKYIFSTINFARSLLDLSKDQSSHIEIIAHPNANKENLENAIQEIFNHKILIKNRVQLNDSLYRMLNTENLVSYLVITLIAIIAMFNVAGAIIMMIIDKKSNIKTLFNLGATLPEIRNIFLFQGTLMTFLGTAIGLTLGVILIVLQQELRLLMITPSLPYPTKLSFINLIVSFLTIISIGTLASLFSSRRINAKFIKF